MLYLFVSILLSFFTGTANASTCGTGQNSSIDYPLNNWSESCGFDVTCAAANHMGVDGVPDSGTVVGTSTLAPCSGVVKEARESTGYGGIVILECQVNDECVTTFSAHMDSSTLQVSSGQTIAKGDVMGYIASSTANGGYAPHIHFGIRKGSYQNSSYSTCHTSNVWYYAGYPHGCYSTMVNDVYNPNEFIDACEPVTQPLETSSRMMVQMVVTEKNGDYFDFNAYFKERIGSGDNDMVELEECVDDSYLDDICAPDIGNPVIEGEGSYTNKNKWLVGNVGGSAHDDMVLITHVDSGFKAHVWISNGDGTFDTRERWLHKSSTQRDLYFLGDYDDDGDDDLITAHDNSSGKVTWNVYKSNGSSAFSSSATSWHSSFGNSTSDEVLLVGDVSGDGKVDIVRGYEASDITDTCSTDGTTKLKWRVVKGGSSSASTWASDGWGCGTSDYMLGDASGDGKDDLIQIRYESDGDARAFVRTSSGSSFNTGSRWRSDFGTNDWRFYVWDVNRDGYDDLIRYRKSTEKMIMGYSTGSSFGTASDELHDSITLTTKNAIRFGQFAYLYMYDGGEEVCE